MIYFVFLPLVCNEIKSDFKIFFPIKEYADKEIKVYSIITILSRVVYNNKIKISSPPPFSLRKVNRLNSE